MQEKYNDLREVYAKAHETALVTLQAQAKTREALHEKILQGDDEEKKDLLKKSDEVLQACQENEEETREHKSADAKHRKLFMIEIRKKAPFFNEHDLLVLSLMIEQLGGEWNEYDGEDIALASVTVFDAPFVDGPHMNLLRIKFDLFGGMSTTTREILIGPVKET
jgi:hypothetical protein